MMLKKGVLAVVRGYAAGNTAPAEWLYKPSDFYSIYDRVMDIAGSNHFIASDVASWCELAVVGEIYEFDCGEVRILDFS